MRIMCLVLIVLLLCASTNVAAMIPYDPKDNVHTHQHYTSNTQMLNDPNCPYNPHNLVPALRHQHHASQQMHPHPSFSEVEVRQEAHPTEFLTPPNSRMGTPQFRSRSVGDESSIGRESLSSSSLAQGGDTSSVKSFKAGQRESTSTSTSISQFQFDDPVMETVGALTIVGLVVKVIDLGYKYCEATFPVQYWALQENSSWVYSMTHGKNWKKIRAALEADKDYTDFVNGTTKSTKYLIPVNPNPLGLTVEQMIWNSYVEQCPFLSSELHRYRPQIYRVNWPAVDEAVQRFFPD